MSGEAFATLLFGISNIETDLASCAEWNDDGTQNILKTINNYLELLDKAKDTLTIIKESLSDDELDKIKLKCNSADGDYLEIVGDEQIIDRFIAFGIAEQIFDEDTENLTESNESDSNSTGESNRSDSDLESEQNTESESASESSSEEHDTESDSDSN